MITTKKSYEIDMCNGTLFFKMLQYALPLMLTGILQLLFNAADMIIVGRFTGANALAAVGSTSALINLITNLFIGGSIGANIMVAKYSGANDKKGIFETVHTAIPTAVICGAAMLIVGIFVAEPALILMGTDKVVLADATLYMRIYFLGMPFMVLYNFGTAILRASGDTKRPLYFLITAGIVNVVLNIFFVTVLNMGVAGVATATVISQGISAILVVICLCKTDKVYKLELRKMKIYSNKLKFMLRYGIPAGIQSAIISFSNVLIQSSVNSFGATVMAANSAAAQIDGFLYVSLNAFTQTAMSFTAANVGAGNNTRIRKIFLQCLSITVTICVVLCAIVYILRYPLLGIFTDDSKVIEYGIIRLVIMCVPYFLLGIMDLLSGCLRGIGCSFTPTAITILGTCLFRIVWIFTVFAYFHSYEVLLYSYAISWIITIIPQAICYAVLLKKKYPKK